jgi:hypothetical protein
MDLSKIPPWAWAVGAVGLGGALYLYKKHKQQQQELLEKRSESSSEAPVIAGVENPAEEFPYSIGGLGGGGSGAIGNALESQNELRELFQQQGTQSKEFEESFTKSEKEFNERIMQQLKEAGEKTTASAPVTVSQGSGGGAPSAPTGGVVTVQSPVTAAPTCPPAFPDHNPARGGVSEHSCYKYSRDRCANKAFPYKHVYQDGTVVCSPT